MASQLPSYLLIPTIPCDFIRQMVAHIDLDVEVSAAVREKIAGLLKKEKLCISEYIDCYETLRAELADDTLGMFPRQVPLGSLSALYHMLYHSPDVATALENYNRFYSLFLADGCQLLDLSELASRGRVGLHDSCIQYAGTMFQVSITIGVLKMLAWLTDQKVGVHELRFNFSKKPLDSEFSYLFGAQPQYEQKKTLLGFEASVLNYPIRPSVTAKDYTEQSVLHLLLWSVADDFSQRVYAQISDRLAGGDFDVNTVASKLNMSKHTLARRLKLMGTSYGQLLERVRRDRAIVLLADEQLSMEEIAAELAYKEVGSFSRAFKLWYGQSPSRYRREA